MTSFRTFLGELAQQISAQLSGDPQCEITGIAPLDKAMVGNISFLNSPQYRPYLETTQASAVVLSPLDAPFYTGNSLIMENPYLGFAKIATLFGPTPSIKSGIHPTAVIGEHCHIASTASIAAHCVIGDGVSIGDNTVVGPGCTIGDNSMLGVHCLLHAHVTLYHDVKIGNRTILHSGAVIGADGFGMVNDKGVWHKIPQLGGVRIGNDVEIGANTNIDRGTLENTVIEDGVKLDNLIQIAHNVHIGAHTAMAAGVMIAGSTQIGKHCMIAGGTVINGHIQITDQVILTANSAILSSINEPGIYSSFMPVQPNRTWKKNLIRFTQLDDIARRLKKLEKNNL